MSQHELQELAERRHDLHTDHPSHRPLSDGYELIGLAGELAFAEASGQKIDSTDRAGGDGGTDFSLRLTIDVKTARKAYNLIVEEGHVYSDIYVLAEYSDESQTARLIGWAWGKEISARPTRDFGSGVINHFIPRAELKPMGALLERMTK